MSSVSKVTQWRPAIVPPFAPTHEIVRPDGDRIQVEAVPRDGTQTWHSLHRLGDNDGFDWTMSASGKLYYLETEMPEYTLERVRR